MLIERYIAHTHVCVHAYKQEILSDAIETFDPHSELAFRKWKYFNEASRPARQRGRQENDLTRIGVWVNLFPLSVALKPTVAFEGCHLRQVVYDCVVLFSSVSCFVFLQSGSTISRKLLYITQVGPVGCGAVEVATIHCSRVQVLTPERNRTNKNKTIGEKRRGMKRAGAQ